MILDIDSIITWYYDAFLTGQRRKCIVSECYHQVILVEDVIALCDRNVNRYLQIPPHFHIDNKPITKGGHLFVVGRKPGPRVGPGVTPPITPTVGTRTPDQLVCVTSWMVMTVRWQTVDLKVIVIFFFTQWTKRGNIPNWRLTITQKEQKNLTHFHVLYRTNQIITAPTLIDQLPSFRLCLCSL